MFGFLKPQLTLDDDPLQSPVTASAWLRGLPPQDVAGRQRQVQTALCDLRRMAESFDRDRIAAIASVDAMFDADRRRLMAQYLTSVDRCADLSDCIWQSMDEMNQAFAVAYRMALDGAFARPGSTSYQAFIPRLLAGLIRCYGIDGKLRAFRYQRLIPAKWKELHQLYRHAQQLSIERLPSPDSGPQPESSLVPIEQEYLCVLLDDRIDTGNLSPAEFDTASRQLRDWSGDLALETTPGTEAGFVVDLEGRSGLVRRTGDECSATLRFVDTTPLVARYRQELAALKRPRLASHEAEERDRQRRIAILEKTLPGIATTADSDDRRHRREPAAANVTVCIGIAHVYDALAAEDHDARLDTVLAKHYQNDTVNRAGPVLWNRNTTAVAVNDKWSDSGVQANAMRVAAVRREISAHWSVVDRSAMGLRLRVSGSVPQGLTVGALVAVRLIPSDGRAEDWVLGTIRRVCRITCDIVEVGVSIFADRVVAATLHTQCAARDDLHFVVDGIDVSTMGATCRGVYIPPKTLTASSSATGTLIIATSNYDTGRRALLAAGDDVHTLVLRKPIEQHADWTWTSIEVVPQPAHSTM